MNSRCENLIQRLTVKCLIDPALRSARVARRLKDQVNAKSRKAQFLLRYLIDPTILPPPGYTRSRADAVYGDVLRRCVEYVSSTRLPGEFLEFGSLLGYTARWFAGLMKEYHLDRQLWLFDSFEGLPDIRDEVDQHSYEVATNRCWYKGAMNVDPLIPERIRRSLSRILPAERIHVVKGYFEDTLTESFPPTRAALVHLDCDLYSSAKYVLSNLLASDRLQDGTLLLFDDYNCNRANPSMGERQALTEVFASQSRWSCSSWFSYGWHGQVFFVHGARDRSPFAPEVPTRLQTV